jgi:plastocyanin
MKGRLGRWKIFVFAAALLVGTAGFMASGDSSVKAQPETFSVLAGSGAQGIAVNLFLPDSLAVHEGDTIEFVNPYEEPHTVTFGEPMGPPDAPANVEAAASFDGSEPFNSGFLEKDDTFSVTFAETGIFNFLCLIHPGMEVRINVVAEGDFVPPQPGPDSPGTQATIDEGLALGEAASDEALAAVKAKNAGATDSVTVETGPAVPFEGSTVDVMRFLEPSVNIPTGGTVVWQNPTAVPHTVTFFAGPPPDDYDPFEQVGPVSGDFDSGALYNGVLATPPFGNNTELSLTFDTAGTYSYICALHANQGMAGVINVGGDVTVTPPSTGDGGLLDHSSGSWMMTAGLAMLLAGLAGTVVVARQRA